MRRYIIFTAVAALTFTIGLIFASIHFFSAHKPLIQVSEPPLSQKTAESSEAELWLAEVFHDFDFVGSSPIIYKYIPSLHHTFILSESTPLFEATTLRPFPQNLEAGQRYILRNHNSDFADPFYQTLESRFHAFGIETSIFIQPSVMAAVTEPIIPARFIDNPPVVIQPMSLVFQGKGFEGLIIRDEYNQTLIGKKPIVKSAVHDYSLIILKKAQ